MNLDFRGLARIASARARVELDSGDSSRLIYAALELRKAMEGLVYERVYAYREELSDATFINWQPRQLFKALMDIDAEADQDVTFAIRLDSERVRPPQEMDFVGKEMVFKSRTIKKHYDALGSFLHLPTIASALEGKSQNLVSLRERCETVISEVDNALASRMHNMIIKITCETACLRCNNMIIQRIPPGEFDIEIACVNCNASYQVKSADENQASFSALKADLSCLKAGCTGTHALWKGEWAEGTEWNCTECSSPHKIALEVQCVVQRS